MAEENTPNIEKITIQKASEWGLKRPIFKNTEESTEIEEQIDTGEFFFNIHNNDIIGSFGNKTEFVSNEIKIETTDSTKKVISKILVESIKVTDSISFSISIKKNIYLNDIAEKIIITVNDSKGSSYTAENVKFPFHYLECTKFIEQPLNSIITIRKYNSQLSIAIASKDIKLPVLLNFGEKEIDREGNNIIFGTTNQQSFQYFYKSNIPIENDFLSCFLGNKHPHTNKISNHDISIANNFPFSESNISNKSFYIARKKRLKRDELCRYFHIYYLNISNNSTISTEPTGWGSVDFLPLVFDSDGKKLSQTKVGMLRNSVGKDFFILIPIEKKTGVSSSYSYSSENIGTVILQPKSFYYKEDKNNKFLKYSFDNNIPKDNYIELSYTDETNTDIFTNVSNLSLAFEANKEEYILLDQSTYFLEIEKEAQSNKISSSNGNKISLVKRRKPYNEANMRSAFNSPGNTESLSSEFTRGRVLKCKFYCNPVEFKNKNFYLISNNKKNDYFIETISDYKSTYCIGTDARKKLQYLPFNNNGSLDFDSTGKIEIIPKFDGRRTLVFKMDLSSSFELNSDFIKYIEHATKIVSNSKRDNEREEYYIFDSNGILLYTERDKGAKSIPAGTYTVIYSYGPYNKDNNGNFIDSSYTGIGNDISSYNSLDNKILSCFSSTLYYDNYLVNDPEYISFDNSKETKTREVYLYNKDKFGNQILKNEPHYEVDENYVSVNGFDDRKYPNSDSSSSKIETLITNKISGNETSNKTLLNNLLTSLSTTFSNFNNIKNSFLNFALTFASNSGYSIKDNNTISISNSTGILGIILQLNITLSEDDSLPQYRLHVVGNGKENFEEFICLEPISINDEYYLLYLTNRDISVSKYEISFLDSTINEEISIEIKNTETSSIDNSETDSITNFIELNSIKIIN